MHEQLQKLLKELLKYVCTYRVDSFIKFGNFFFYLKAGSKAPLLVLPKAVEYNDKYKYAALCSILGAFQELYVVS